MSFYSSISLYEIYLAASSREITLFHVTNKPMNYWHKIPKDLSFLYFPSSSLSLSTTVCGRLFDWLQVFSLFSFNNLYLLLKHTYFLVYYWEFNYLIAIWSQYLSFLFLNLDESKFLLSEPLWKFFMKDSFSLFRSPL